MNNDSGHQIQITGMVWYKPENYDRIRSMCEDGNKLHDTYDKWLKAAENSFKDFESKGYKILQVNLDPVEFASWCEKKGVKLNAAARNRYVNEKLGASL